MAFFEPLFQQFEKLGILNTFQGLAYQNSLAQYEKFHKISFGAGLILQGIITVLTFITAYKSGEVLGWIAFGFDTLATIGPLFLLFSPLTPATVLTIRFFFHLAHLYWDIFILTDAWKEEKETAGGGRMLRTTTISIYEEVQHFILMKLTHNFPPKQSRTKHGVFKYYHGRLPNSGAQFIAISR